MLFDTHAHLDDKAYNSDREYLLKELCGQNICVLNCGCDEKSSYLSTVLAKKYPNLYAAVGVHPHDAKTYTDALEERLNAWARLEKVVAVGEIGLDYHYDHSPRNIQREVFVRQIRLAGSLNLPVCVHSRDAAEDTYEILKRELRCGRGAVLHSFSQSPEMLRRYLDMPVPVYFSISGPVTFSNASKLREVVKQIPKERLLIETDSPYLTPAPFRGKRNSPAYVEYVAEKIAEIRAVSYEDLCGITYGNAEIFLNL